MKISLNQINQYTDIKISTEELIDKIKSQIGEVESTQDLAKKYEHVVIAEIAEAKPHPEAEKLSIYQVNIGDKTVQVVAGGPILTKGDKIGYIPVDTKVPHNAYPDKFDGIIKKVTLRGEESNGMLGSALELDVNSNHERVLVLDTDAKPGTSFAKAYKLDDLVIDVENKALTNRPDLFGHIGLAREIAGIQNIQYKTVDWYSNPNKLRPTPLKEESLKLEVENNAEALCYRYMAVVLKDIEIKDSPLWLQLELSKVGIRPINNVVDITNYMMTIAAQPMHAFDYDKVLEKDTNTQDRVKIIVRPSKKGESITTLDDKTHELEDNMIMICDSESPIAVAGVMGGLDTEISDETTNIILEVANFDMYSIRKTSNLIGIHSDAVTCYARGQDPHQCEPTIYKAIEMLKELAGANQASNIVDNYPIPVEPWDVEVSMKRLNAHLGVNLTKADVINTLQNIEITAKEDSTNQDQLIVNIPTYRRDLRIREDVHEDIARLYGYENIKLSLPKRTIKPIQPSEIFELRHKVREVNQNLGANEILTYNFISKETLNKTSLDLEKAYHIRNPLSPELEYMRTTLSTSILDKVNQNLRKGYDKIVLYEVNKAHNRQEIDADKLPIEHNNVALTVCVDDKHKQREKSGSPFYTAKFYIEKLLNQLGLINHKYELLSTVNISELPIWLQEISKLYIPEQAALITVSKDENVSHIGVVGEYKKGVRKYFKLPDYSAGYEINLNSIILLTADISNYNEPSRYPAVNNDVTLKMPTATRVGDVKDHFLSLLEDSERIVRVDIADIYQPENNEVIKNVTFSISIQNRNKTLEGDEVKYLLNDAVKGAEDQFSASVVE